MDFSIVAINRMLEDSIKEGRTNKEVLVKNGKTVLSEIRRLEDKSIIERLNNLGVSIEKEAFYESIKKYISSEEYYIWLMDEKKLKVKGMDEDILWMCLTVLWERWFPEIPNFEMVDDKIYLGYMLLKERKCAEACDLWWDAWNNIIYLMNQHKISGMNEFDNKFRGTQSVSNWSSDFEMELSNAGIDEQIYFERRIEFCSEYVKRSEEKHDINIEAMKRSIAESYINLGKLKEGDDLFESYLREDPKWGWGWIGWSDSYWIFHGNKYNDYPKAEAILKKALTVEALRDKADVMERLMNFYEDTGREGEATEIERELNLNRLEKNKHLLESKMQSILSTKIGRNDPCPCGSGKKYKKCCGK